MDDKDQTACNNERRCKLGVALSGGGFRASLFHLGVLRRMAELDLLRYVEILSTVSGGSIIGALYALLLKKHLDAKNPLDRDDYITLIDELDAVLVNGIKKNLRTRLLMNPLGLLRVLLTSDSLGKRMSRIYERYIYSDIVKDLQSSASPSFFRPGRFKLNDLLITPGKKQIQHGLEEYNREAVYDKGSVITKIIFNATTLNSGAPFWFSSVEIGDPRLGFFRYDEIAELQQRKYFLEMNVSDLQKFIDQQASTSKPALHNGRPISLQASSLALWWKRYRAISGPAIVPIQWRSFLIDPSLFYDIAPVLIDSDFGELRIMKIAAWYICRGMNNSPYISGGLSINEHMERFWDAFSRINKSVSSSCKIAATDIAFRNYLLELVLELYYLRTAEIMSKKIEKNWNNLTVGEAVGASACFPPVFPPFLMLDFYDDIYVTRLGLTDGGVYDNIGLSALLDECCTHIIASDTSGLLNVQQQSSAGRISMSGRIVSILMDDVATLQRNELRVRRSFTNAISTLTDSSPEVEEVRNTSGLEGLAFFHIASPTIVGPGVNPNINSNLLASLRTDLDGFGDIEIAALVNHGYDIADRYIRTHLADTPYFNSTYWLPASRVPKPMGNVPQEKIERVLKAGESRFFRSVKLLAPMSLAFLVLVLGGLVFGAFNFDIQLSIQDIIMWVQNKALTMIETTFPFLKSGWTNYKVATGPAILIIISVILLIIIAKSLFSDKFKYQYLRQFRIFYTIGKWSRTLAPKLIWLVGGGSIIIAFVVSVLAVISHVFFYLPFESMTRIHSNSKGRDQ